ncbi:efflux RND transporter periplasmic adaptor subunit [Salinisphaera sp. S4-8]|uniref:efflux RND transporter periplasmic adaptor subunit n=1 Tax=Salinisphaera sp. S4-8 TaxID=633357 RepID=UPI00333E713A
MSRPRRTRWRGVLIALGACVSLSACTSEQPPQPTPPKPIAWAVAQVASSGQTRSIAGVLQTPERAPVGFDVPGRVARINVDTGDVFARGDVLATLDDRSYALTLEQRKAELAEARAARELSSTRFARSKSLRKADAISQAEYDNDAATLASDRSRVDTARARVNIAAKDLADTRLIAPYDGSVARRLVEPAQRVQAGETVLEIQSRDDGMEVVVSAPETLVGVLDRDAMHTVTLAAAPNAPMMARISEVATDAGDRNAYPVTLVIAKPVDAARAGMTAEVTLRLSNGELAQPARIEIPVTAFAQGADDDTFVYVFDPDSDRLVQRSVEVADISGDKALISAGLDPGEIVASQGLAFLHDGQSVTRIGVGPRQFNE